MKIMQVPSANKTPVYEDENVALWTGDNISVLLNIKRDKNIYMDHEGWEELAKAITSFNTLEEKPFDIDAPMQVLTGKYRDGAVAIGLFYGGIALFTSSEWDNFSASILQADKRIQALWKCYKVDEDQYLKLNDSEIAKLESLAEFNLQLR